MTELRFEKKIFKGAHLNGCSDLPAMRNSMHTKMQTRLDEDDELFVGYGNLKNILPYQMQDRYDRAEDDIEFHTAVLENDYLKATFVPDLGGRMWSLYDKVNKKDPITATQEFVVPRSIPIIFPITDFLPNIKTYCFPYLLSIPTELSWLPLPWRAAKPCP